MNRGSLMKKSLHTNEAPHENRAPPSPEMVQETLRPCLICGRLSRPWGYVNGGRAHVCGVACQREYDKTRFSK